MTQYSGELKLLYNRISRTVNLPITFSFGCDLNDKFVQEIELSNLRSFEGFVYDMNIYQGKYLMENFISEMTCMGNEETLINLASMTDLVDAVRAVEKAGLAAYEQTSDEMLCHIKCIHLAQIKKTPNKSRNCRAHRDPKNLDARNCEKHCRRIPKSVENVDLCLNCMLYQFHCPIVKHLTKSISYNKDDPDFHVHKLVPWLLDHRESLLPLGGNQAVQSAGFGCRSHWNCYKNKLSGVVESCKRKEGLYWDVWNPSERLSFRDDTRCDVVIRTFSCLVDVIGDWTYRRDFPDCLIRSGTSTDMNCYRGVRQLNALHHLTLQPNFTAQFCQTNYDRTVKIAPSCDEVQFLPVQWSPTDFEGVSIEPNYVPWTEVTILGVISTTMVSGKTESSGDVPTSLPTETLAVKGNDIEILLLRILTGCFITASVVFLAVWFGLKCRKKDQEVRNINYQPLFGLPVNC
ncbi:hypothetical protein ACHWQZ_G009669 [Mnemiopsis leidyi]